jgi:hypothetical protein
VPDFLLKVHKELKVHKVSQDPQAQDLQHKVLKELKGLKGHKVLLGQVVYPQEIKELKVLRVLKVL